MPIVNITAAGFSPVSITVTEGDTIQWINSTAQVQDATGQTFATGPIQPGATSLPLLFNFADPGLSYNSTPSGFQGTVVVSAAQEIVHFPQVRALFTDEDVNHMKPLGLDLSKKAEVSANIDDIIDRVTRNGAGRMPPPPRPKFTEEQVNVLRNWKAAGFPD